MLVTVQQPQHPTGVTSLVEDDDVRQLWRRKSNNNKAGTPPPVSVWYRCSYCAHVHLLMVDRCTDRFQSVVR